MCLTGSRSNICFAIDLNVCQRVAPLLGAMPCLATVPGMEGTEKRHSFTRRSFENSEKNPCYKILAHVGWHEPKSTHTSSPPPSQLRLFLARTLPAQCPVRSGALVAARRRDGGSRGAAGHRARQEEAPPRRRALSQLCCAARRATRVRSSDARRKAVPAAPCTCTYLHHTTWTVSAVRPCIIHANLAAVQVDGYSAYPGEPGKTTVWKPGLWGLRPRD